MKDPKRDLLVLLKQDFMDQRGIEKEVENLNDIIQDSESPHSFCLVHELVDRNFITSNVKRILQVSKLPTLKPFRFLINKN
jgi:hypothetical protein